MNHGLKERAMIMAVIVIAAVVVYLNSISGAFVYDDISQIIENPWIKDIRHLPDIFLTDVWAFQGTTSNFYRPIMFTLFMADYHLFGLNPWGFHLTSIALHAGVSLLVFLVACVLLQPAGAQKQTGGLPATRIAGIAGLLFATHPIHTESVAWIAGMTDLSFSLFYLLAFYLYIRSEGRWSVGALICFFLASLCKETALTLPILLFAYDVLVRRNVVLTADGVVSLIRRYLPFLIVALIYFALRSYVIGDFAPARSHQDLSAYEYFINIFPLFAQYLGKLILPICLNIAYVFHPISSLLTWQGGLGLLALAVYMVGVFTLVRFNRTAAFALLWVAIPLLPVLYIPALGLNTFAERYLYLPSAGFVLLVSMGLDRLAKSVPAKRPLMQRMALSAALIIAGLYATGTIQRNTVWHDPLTLWTDAVKKSPDGYMSHNNLGDAYARLGMTEKAAREYGIALKYVRDIPDKSPDRLISVGMSYMSRGKTDIAITQFQTALRVNPEHAGAHFELARAYEDKGMPDQAIEAYRNAIRFKPDFANAYYHLGILLAGKGQLDQAVDAFQKVLQIKPDHLTYNNLGVVYAMQGKADEAMSQFKKALELAPDYDEAHFNLGVSYEERGETDQAISEYLNTIRLRPGHLDARYSLAHLYEQMGDLDKAESQLRQLLQIAPDHKDAREALLALQRRKPQSGGNSQ